MSNLPIYTWNPAIAAQANVRGLRNLAKGWVIIAGQGWQAKVWTEPTKPRGWVQVLTTDDGKLRCGSACDQTLAQLAEFFRGSLTRHGLAVEP